MEGCSPPASYCRYSDVSASPGTVPFTTSVVAFRMEEDTLELLEAGNSTKVKAALPVVASAESQRDVEAQSRVGS